MYRIYFFHGYTRDSDLFLNYFYSCLTFLKIFTHCGDLFQGQKWPLQRLHNGFKIEKNNAMAIHVILVATISSRIFLKKILDLWDLLTAKNCTFWNNFNSPWVENDAPSIDHDKKDEEMWVEYNKSFHFLNAESENNNNKKLF